MAKKPRLIPVLVITGLVIYALFYYKRPYQECVFYSMGGIKTEIKMYNVNGGQGNKLCAQVKDRYEELEAMFSTYRASSLINQINSQAYKNPVKVTPEMLLLLERSIDISKKTGGYFDITVKPALDMWFKAQQNKKLPAPEEMNKILQSVSYKLLKLNKMDSTVTFLKAGVKIDMGAIAKGYMTDCAREILLKGGVQRALINSGGDLVVYDLTDSPSPFKIGIFNPSAAQSDETYELTNGSIVTSGNYNRFYEIENEKFSHIINPHTARPDGGCVSVTVTARDGLTADAYATAFCANPELRNGDYKDDSVKTVSYTP